MNPTELNYRMPAEWEPHERTYMSWPIQDSMCYPESYEEVCEQYYAELAAAIAEFEPVTVIVNAADESKVKERLAHLPNVSTLVVEHNDAWLRDNGPTFLLNAEGGQAGVNWRFNAWGGKYSPWDLDDAVAPQILKAAGVKQFDAPLVLEGGSVHSDGEGTLLTTEECLLHTNRNPELNREQIEEYVKQYLNVQQIVWLNHGLSGDETDGHVDNIACFAAPGKIIMQVCYDPSDENYAITQENLKRLEDAVDAKGRKLEVIAIEQPPKAFYEDQRLTLSYLNFYFVNGGIILPIFGGEAEETDRKAIEALSKAFPEHRIRTIDGMAIIREGGNVHCTTQQMPAGLK